jgi:hypothetical protein
MIEVEAILIRRNFYPGKKGREEMYRIARRQSVVISMAGKDPPPLGNAFH